MPMVLFVADDLHRGWSMAEVLESQIRDSSPPTHSLNGSSGPMKQILYIQEYPICV